MPNPTILAFDLGGVLASCDNSSLLAATGVTEEIINLKHVVTHFELGGVDRATFYKFARKQFQVDCSEETFFAAWKATIRLDIEMIGVLKAVSELGLGLAVMTNLDIVRAVALQELLANHGLNNVTICCSGEFGYTKPSMSFFYDAARKIGQPANRILLIDDSAENVAAASQFGLHTVRFSTVAELRNELMYWTICI